jgi:hypothetical protein
MHNKTNALALSAVTELPSLRPTNETSPIPASEHSQGRVDAQSTATVQETTVVLHAAPENLLRQPFGDQTGDVAPQIPAQYPQHPQQPQQLQQPSLRRIHVPLQHFMLHAASILIGRTPRNKPMTPEESSRYSTLYGACVNADLFFLVIHRYYNCWLVKNPTVYSHFRLSVDDINKAFAQLRVIFKDEDRISPPHRLWFSEFPEVGENVYCALQIQRQIQDFILAFSVHWPDMMQAAQAQMMPLMEYHIREQLKCPSLTMANKLFVHSRRIIGIPDNQFTNEATLLFNMDQKLERLYAELNEPAADVAEARQSMKLTYQRTIENIRRNMNMHVATQG